MPFSMSGSDAYSYNRFDAYEAKLKPQKEEEVAETEEEVLEEGGCGKYQEGGEVKPCDKKEDDADAKRMKKFQELQKGVDLKKKEVKEGMHRDAKTGEVVDKAEIGKIYYPAQPKKKTSVAKRKEMELKKEDLALFSAEEIEALGLLEYKGYQEGGEVKDCEKCKGKGCDHCKDKGTHSKKEKGAKPDYLDFDKDGNKEEPMKKALKEKGAKKN